MSGLGCGWVAPILNQLKDSKSEYSLTAAECSWIASLFYMSKGVGPFLSAALIDNVGRSPVFAATACVCFSMWIAVLLTKAVLGHYIVRLFFGLAVGMFETAVNIYIGENSSPGVRGTFSGVLVTSVYGGELVAFILATYLSYNNIAIAHAVFGLVTLVSLILLREPAQFLIMKGKVKDAERNYYWLRGSRNGNARLELADIKQHVLEEKSKRLFKELFHCREAWKSLRVVISIIFLSFWTGISAITSFITMTFPESDHLTSNQFTILFGVLQLISCCISSNIIDKFNRRPLLLVSCAVAAITQGATAALYYTHRSWHILYFDWLVFATLTTYCCVYGMFMYPLASAILGELLPQGVKAIGACMAVVVGSVASFTTTWLFLPIGERYGMETNFVLYFVVSLVMLVYVYFDLPETRGKSLVEIQRTLKEGHRSDVGVPPEVRNLVDSG